MAGEEYIIYHTPGPEADGYFYFRSNIFSGRIRYSNPGLNHTCYAYLDFDGGIRMQNFDDAVCSVFNTLAIKLSK